MSTWHVRREGSPMFAEAPSAQAVADGLKDGVWSGEDEVRGPDDGHWQSLEDHPQFAAIVAELEPPKAPPEDEARLDMNPLIDVALVLLIFFILTTSYATLRRSIDLPEAPNEDKGKTTKQPVQDIRERVFKVKVFLGDDAGVLVQVEEKTVPLADAEREITATVKGTGKREMYLDVGGEKCPGERRQRSTTSQRDWKSDRSTWPSRRNESRLRHDRDARLVLSERSALGWQERFPGWGYGNMIFMPRAANSARSIENQFPQLTADLPER